MGREVRYKEVSTARADDIVVSHINAVNRAICVMPEISRRDAACDKARHP